MPDLGFVCYRFLYMVEVLLGATCLMLHVCWGGRLQLCLVNNSEEVLFSLSLFVSKLRVDPRRHNNRLQQPGCLMLELFFNS